MDLDKALVSAIIHEGVSAVRTVRDRGVIPEFLSGDAAGALKFILEYYKNHNSIPTAAVIEGKTGVLLDAPEGPAEFFISEVLNRRLFFRLQVGVNDLVEILKKRDPQGALESLDKLVKESRRECFGVGTQIEKMGLLTGDVVALYDRIKAGERGVLTPWPSVNEETYGFWPQDLVIFVGRLGKGKCVDKSTLIQDPDTGVLRTIEEVFRDGAVENVLSWSKEKGIHSASITAKVDTGEKKCLEVTLGTGRSIVVTPEHPFLTPSGWIRADKLVEGNSIGLPAYVPAPKNPVRIPNSGVDGLALMLANGVLSKNKVIPEEIFRLPLDQLSRLIGFFWLCVGYVNSKGPGLTLASEVFARQLQHLLLRFGIQSSVKYKKYRLSGKIFDSWRLRVYSHSLDEFAMLPICGNQRKKLNALLSLPRKPNVGMPVVSEDVVERLRDIASRKEVEGKFGWSSQVSFKNLFGAKECLLLRRLKVFCKVFQCEDEFRWLYDSGLFWDRVVAIKDAGKRKIYDLSVVPSRCFVANDIVVHNSWLAVYMAHYARLVQGKKVLFATTEMSKVKIAQRFCSIALRLPYDELRKGQLGIHAEEKFRNGVEAFLNLEGFDVVGGDFDFRVESFCAAVEEREPEIVFLDGAYLIRVDGGNRTERAANAFDELKRLANRLRVPVVVTTQFNREVKSNVGGTARVESIALTDVAGWNGDVIYGAVQSDEMKRDRKMDLQPLKVREGPGIENVSLNWDFSIMDFSEIPKDDADSADDSIGDLASSSGGLFDPSTVPF